MRGTWVVNTCQAPVRSRSGILRCVLTREGCDYPGHRRYNRVALLAAIVWWLRPWWPNRLGRAQDRGQAHTCPTVQPCAACNAPRTHCDLCSWWVETGIPAANRSEYHRHLREAHP